MSTTSQLDALINNMSNRLNEFERAGTFNPTSRGIALSFIFFSNPIGNCALCSRDIIGKTLEAQGFVYHPECFSCSRCRNLLEGNYFVVDSTCHPLLNYYLILK